MVRDQHVEMAGQLVDTHEALAMHDRDELFLAAVQSWIHRSSVTARHANMMPGLHEMRQMP